LLRERKEFAHLGINDRSTMKKTGGIFVALVVAFAFCPGNAGARAKANPAKQQVLALFNAVNATRLHHGLHGLRGSQKLNRSSVMKAEDIRRCGSFSHTPCGMSFTRTFQQTGYFRGRVLVGENLYWGSGSLGDAPHALAAWLASPPHRANLLRPDWHDVGIGLVHAPSLFGAGNVWVYVMQFGRHR
jgi:uncharacterized protein YkwD